MTSYAVGPALLWGLLWVSVGVLAVQLAMMVGVRLVRAARGRRRGRLVAPLRPLLLELASGDEAADEEVAAALSGMSGPIRDVVDDSILALMGKIRGDSLAPLVDVLRRHGRDRRARADLRSRSPVSRARAAWTLGVMQEHGAVRRVLPLLQDPSPDVALTAARALGMMGDPVAVTPILAAVAPAGSRPGLPAGSRWSPWLRWAR